MYFLRNRDENRDRDTEEIVSAEQNMCRRRKIEQLSDQEKPGQHCRRDRWLLKVCDHHLGGSYDLDALLWQQSKQVTHHLSNPNLGMTRIRETSLVCRYRLPQAIAGDTGKRSCERGKVAETPETKDSKKV